MAASFSHPLRTDFTGLVRGRLTIVERAGFFIRGNATGTRRKRYLWLCRCSCGKSKLIQHGALKSLHTNSCGCLKIEQSIERIKKISTKHGQSKSPKFKFEKNKKRAIIKRQEIKTYKEKIGCLNPSCQWTGFYPGSILEFHHVDPATKLCNVSYLIGCSDELLWAEINKCTLLCANCHNLAHNKEINSLNLSLCIVGQQSFREILTN